LKKGSLLSPEEAAKHTEHTKKMEALDPEKKGLKVQIEVTQKNSE
jgi:hypothetical protein